MSKQPKMLLPSVVCQAEYQTGKGRLSDSALCQPLDSYQLLNARGNMKAVGLSDTKFNKPVF